MGAKKNSKCCRHHVCVPPRLSAFSNMKGCVYAGDYDCAADEIMYTSPGSGVLSNYCSENRKRCDKLVSMMRWQTIEHGYTEADIGTSQCDNCHHMGQLPIIN